MQGYGFSGAQRFQSIFGGSHNITVDQIAYQSQRLINGCRLSAIGAMCRGIFTTYQTTLDELGCPSAMATGGSRGSPQPKLRGFSADSITKVAALLESP